MYIFIIITYLIIKCSCSITKSNQDEITRKYRQKLVCELWIIAFSFYLIWSERIWKVPRGLRYGSKSCLLNPYQALWLMLVRCIAYAKKSEFINKYVMNAIVIWFWCLNVPCLVWRYLKTFKMKFIPRLKGILHYFFLYYLTQNCYEYMLRGAIYISIAVLLSLFFY